MPSRVRAPYSLLYRTTFLIILSRVLLNLSFSNGRSLLELFHNIFLMVSFLISSFPNESKKKIVWLWIFVDHNYLNVIKHVIFFFFLTRNHMIVKWKNNSIYPLCCLFSFMNKITSKTIILHKGVWTLKNSFVSCYVKAKIMEINQQRVHTLNNRTNIFDSLKRRKFWLITLESNFWIIVDSFFYTRIMIRRVQICIRILC